MIKTFTSCFLFLLIFLSPLSPFGQMDQALASVSEPLKYLPVQAGGRVKPYDTFAREALQLVYGKQSYHGKSAGELVFTWLLTPDQWLQKSFVEINRKSLKKNLKLDQSQKYFTPKEIFQNPRLPLILQELHQQREDKIKLNPYFQSVARLENQLVTFQSISSGQAFHLIPPSDVDEKAGKKNNWISLSQINKDSDTYKPVQKSFEAITKAFLETIVVVQSQGDEKLAEKNLHTQVSAFIDLARSYNKELYPDSKTIAIEVHYNNFQPFLWAWIIYLLAAIFWGMALSGRRNWATIMGWSALILGLGIHTYGFILRVYLTQRPPVSNMYETVVWVSFGVVLFAIILGKAYRKKLILLAGSVVGCFSLVVAGMAPVILDASLQPLEPVLRSNLWLTVHVLTITISYAAFFLAFGLADVGLYYFLRGDSDNSPSIRSVADSIYRCIQIGVVLLAAGTILGGVWADYSWGRFWGWDPKETWALIALLGYITILHGRIAGWLHHFGMVVGSLLAFSLVIMAWYGVNYILGAGLHSYGFGGGGVEYVSIFVALHVIYALVVFTVRKERLKLSS